MLRRFAIRAEYAPSAKGDAKCITSGAKPSSKYSSLREGTAIGMPIFMSEFSGSAGTRLTLAPQYSFGPPILSGAITSASWPRLARCSTTRRTEFVTPFTCGKKLSVTIATFISCLQS